jgi:uncharacterized protein (TIGR02145 family)
MKQKLTITLSVFLTAAILFFACKDEELPEAPNSSKIQLTITEDITSYVSSTINCSLNDLPPFGIEQHGFCWDTISGVDINKQSKNFGQLNKQSFKETIDGLLPNKTYYIKAFIKSSNVVIYSNELTIQTLARPIVTTTDIINITANSAQSGGTATAPDLFPITQRGVCWAKTENPVVSDSITIDSLENDTFSSVISNLEAGELYYVRAYAINSEGIGYGEEKIFETLDGNPDFTTDSITDITATSAIFYGNIENNDGLEILEKGFCWSTITNPTTGNNSISVSGDELGSFYAEVSGLDVNKTYNVRAYLKNSEGTFYGNQITFTTEDGLPSGLTTTAITNITATTATSGGEITDDGGFAITACGVCWSTSTNPTIADAHTTDGTGTGSFVSNLTNLSAGTTYYVRAYATNSVGTAYGEEKSFTTTGTQVVEVTNPATGKTWMDRNLGASRAATSSTDEEAYGDLYQWGRAADGHQKRNSATTSTLSNSDTPGHGNFITSDSSPYDWRSPQNDNLWQGVNGTNNPCPAGYRLPTEAEWEAERQSWSSNDVAGAFASPLKLPVAGYRGSSDGSLGGVGSYGYYWASTVSGAFVRNLHFRSSDASMDSDTRANGLSVRCLKD